MPALSSGHGGLRGAGGKVQLEGEAGAALMLAMSRVLPGPKEQVGWVVPQVLAGSGRCPLPEVQAQSEGQRRALPRTTPRGPRRMGLHTPSQRGSLRPLRPHLFLPASTVPPALGQGWARAQGCRSLWKTLHPLGLVVYWPMGAAPGAWCHRAPVRAGRGWMPK